METVENKTNIQKEIDQLADVISRCMEIVREITRIIMDACEKIFGGMGRFVIKILLLKWHTPNSIVDWIVKRLSWQRAWVFGVYILEKNLLL